VHVEAYDAVDRMITASGIDRTGQWTGLDIGGRNVNGSARGLLPATRWTGLDSTPGPGVDIVADARHWVVDRLVDVVLCTEVFEHVQDWWLIPVTAREALDPAGPGLVLFTCASTGRPPHGASGAPAPAPGEWYENITIDRLRHIAESLWRDVHITYNPNPGDAYLWARRPWED
jgi:hypothetical protein